MEQVLILELIQQFHPLHRGLQTRSYCMSCLQKYFIKLQIKSSSNKTQEGHNILLNGTEVQREIISFSRFTYFQLKKYFCHYGLGQKFKSINFFIKNQQLSTSMFLFYSNTMMNVKVWPRFKILWLIMTNDHRPHKQFCIFIRPESVKKEKAREDIYYSISANLTGCLSQLPCVQILSFSPYGGLFLRCQLSCGDPSK